ncbi:MAG TPA: hypothetical protein VLK84_21580 [Longimicrobium sp.]|nr:hypothetical protein [Longimicrobium sp.]
MNKLTLRLDSLEVESFSTHAVQRPSGTVLAHSGFSCNTYNEMTCAQYQTCGGLDTCNAAATCNPMCWPQPPIDYKEGGLDESGCCTRRCS